MTEERMKVLEILQEGKIKAEDAARLFEALNKMPADEGGAVKVKVKVETHHHEDGGEIEARIEEEIEAKIDEEVDAEVDEDVKMKIKVKTHHNEDA